MVFEMLLLYLAQISFISCWRASRIPESFCQLSGEKKPDVMEEDIGDEEEIEDEDETEDEEDEEMVFLVCRIGGLVFNSLRCLFVT